MRYYLVTWDNLGVEFFTEITKYHPDNVARETLFASIKKGEKQWLTPSFNIEHLKLRARFNPQRHYEIYVFTSDDDLDEDAIKAWFESDPQGFADWVRENHSLKILDDRASSTKPVII